MNHYQAIILTPFGTLGITSTPSQLTGIHFLPASTKPIAPDTPFVKNITQQLNAYFNHQAFNFDLPMTLIGTAFQQRVWAALKKIPPRKTVTYGELAKQLTTSARAIGNACRNNPIPIIIPCHRVLAKNNLGGYMGKRDGEYFSIKQKLLEHEGA